MAINLQQAISTIKAGDKGTGKRLLTQALQTDPRDETAWLWLAYVVDSDKQRRECFERVLALNPAHEKARRGLASLNGSASSHSPALPPAALPQLPASPPPPVTEPVAPSPATAPEPAPPKREPARRPGYLGGVWTVILLLVSLGIISQANLPARWNTWAQFAQAGVTSRATVVDTRLGEQDVPYITYRFEAPAAAGDFSRLEKEERVSPEIYQLLEPGSQVRVQYLFENPQAVRLAGSDSLGNLIFWTALGLVTGMAGLSRLLGLAGRVIKQGPALFKKTPPKPAVVWQGEGPPPLKQWSGTYTLGQDNYEGFFVIETEDGIFLGEGGMEIWKTVPQTSPKQPVAFDVGLFDKTDITTLSKVIMSEQAYHDETLRATVEAKPHAEAVLAQPGATFTLESRAMRVEAKIDELAYGQGGPVYFEKLTVSLAIFVKEGIDLAQPMDVPEQFR